MDLERLEVSNSRLFNEFAAKYTLPLALRCMETLSLEYCASILLASVISSFPSAPCIKVDGSLIFIGIPFWIEAIKPWGAGLLLAACASVCFTALAGWLLAKKTG